MCLLWCKAMWCGENLYVRINTYTSALVHRCTGALVHRWTGSALDKMASLDLPLRNRNTLPLPTKRRLLMTTEEGMQNLHSVHLRAISQFYFIPSNALQKKIFWLIRHRRLLFWTRIRNQKCANNDLEQYSTRWKKVGGRSPFIVLFKCWEKMARLVI